MPEFEAMQKIARLSRTCTVTEKIDGTNGSIYISDDATEFLVGSRTRWVTPADDNYGFARWANEHKEELLQLGPGHHFGEWWGCGIQRKYNQSVKRFSLFNTDRWKEVRPTCCDLVPVLYQGPFETPAIEAALELLRTAGSVAAPGFMKPEGIVVYHHAARQLFKKTVDGDAHKG